MIIVKPEDAPNCCRSEREFMRAVHDHRGVYIANVNVPNSSTPGAFTREVDGVMLTPEGIYTVEVKGLRASGILQTPRMDAWTVVDGETRVPLMGRPHSQALMHSKFLASFLKNTGVAPGWIRAVLAIVGEDITLPDNADVLLTDNVYVVISRPGIGSVLSEQVMGAGSQRELSIEMVQTILTTFGCVESAPSTTDLLSEGFRSESDIASGVEEKRQQVREEYLAATGTQPGNDVEAGSAAPEISDGPSSSEWRITKERYAATVALDAELTETGTIVDGVPMHRRLVSYAQRKGVALGDVAKVVNFPTEVLGDDTDSNLVHLGEEFAVSVRVSDGLAMFYKPVDVARAERHGVTVNGLEISPRAAKQATNQFDISLESVTRIVTEPQEKWWVPGTTDIAHARGDFVAVTSGHLGQVLYLQTRAVAVSRAVAKPAEVKPNVVDVVLDGITVRASAVGWCARRQVELATLVAAASAPESVWAGHSANMEVRTAKTVAVLLDIETKTVVAVMTPSEAIEYRDGIVKEGVHLSGRCLFLAKRRKVSIDDIISAFLNPVTIARAPGATESVYVGSEVAVTVTDSDHTVADFTFAGHARSMIQRSELVPVEILVEDSPVSGDVCQPRRLTSTTPSKVAVGRQMHTVAAARVPPVTPSPLLLARKHQRAG